jgi:hypothetical protein
MIIQQTPSHLSVIVLPPHHSGTTERASISWPSDISFCGVPFACQRAGVFFRWKHGDRRPFLRSSNLVALSEDNAVSGL